MKFCIFQPLYSLNFHDSDNYFQKELEYLDQCDETMDVIVLPEYGDIPAFADTPETFTASREKYGHLLLEKSVQTARRCHAVVFVNACGETEHGWRNTTHAINQEGCIVGTYCKRHLVASEEKRPGIETDYTYRYEPPCILELDGIRYGFLTCYDFYFYESYSVLARENVDVIIGCSHQRSDTHQALDIIGRFLAYHTNAYLVRSSVTLGPDSLTGGCSMVVAPDGTKLLDMGNREGMGCTELDPHAKYLKPAGFSGATKAHWEYIEEGRHTWDYRPAGPATVPDDAHMPYPRVCAHRGFNTIAPENSMPAYGAAVAMGAEEIEFDLWCTKDGEIVSIHDSNLDRVSDGTGNVWEYTYQELLQFDFGKNRGAEFSGLKIPTFEDILKKFARQTIMNIHLKTLDETSPYDESMLRKILGLWKQYDVQKHAYLMTNNSTVIAQARSIMPEILVCRGAGHYTWDLVDVAIRDRCDKVQLMRPYVSKEMTRKAHEHGIICNVFWSDEPELTREYLDMGVDTILTNDFQRNALAVQSWKQEHLCK